MDEAPVEALRRILRAGGVRSVYQPLVDIEDGTVVGYEALARGPEGSPLESPDALFAAARAAGLLAELDWACQGAALQGALDAGMTAPLRLFVNVEPEVLDRPPPPSLAELQRVARARLAVVVECTERALASKPAELLAAMRTAREQGFAIALDDLGAERDSLALMPFLRPDVIKLDLRLVQGRPDTVVAALVGAVQAEVERTGAVLLAEGIETEGHERVARSLGATLGQGWRYGRPGPLPAELPVPARALPAPRPVAPTGLHPTPFELGAAARATRTADKRLLVAISIQLEHQASVLGESVVVLSALQEARHLTPRTVDRYTALADGAAFVALLGAGLGPEPVPGTRGAVLSARDPVRGEWDIAVVGPHFAAALVARDLGDDGPDAERRFEFVLTYDRDIAVGVASSLMARIRPLAPLPTATTTAPSVATV